MSQTSPTMRGFGISELMALPGLTPIAVRLSLAVERQFRQEAKKRGVSADALRRTHDAVVTYGDASSPQSAFAVEFVERDPTGALPRVRVFLLSIAH